MLVLGETYTQRKRELLDLIRVSRSLLRECNKHLSIHPELKDELRAVMDAQDEDIKTYMHELMELERYRIVEGLERDEPFKPRSMKEAEAKRTDAEWDEYRERVMAIDEEIAKLEGILNGEE